MQTLMDRGYVVHGIAPRGPYTARLEAMGVQFHHWNMDPNTMNPAREAISFMSLLRILRYLRPTLVHNFTIKPNILGSLAARVTGVPAIISSYTGLGYLFIEGGTKSSNAQRILRPAIRLAARICDAVTFQNGDDMTEMARLGLVPEAKGVLVPGGSGINIKEFSPEAASEDAKSELRKELGINEKSAVITYVGRMLFNKGVNEFVASAQVLKERGLSLKILLVGSTDHNNPRAIPLQQLKSWEQQGLVTYLGHREDVIPLLGISDVVVLPSYREGVPRALLEASAMGKAIVTTDSIGCREVVEHELNGLLVNQRNVPDLVEAIQRLAQDRSLREKYGNASREKAVLEFDERKVIEATISVYNQVLDNKRRKAITGEETSG